MPHFRRPTPKFACIGSSLSHLLTNLQRRSDIRQEQLTRLLNLIRERSTIETAIADSHTRLNQSYETASKELRRCTKHHTDKIRNAIAAVAQQSGNEPGQHEQATSNNKENEAPPAAKSGKGLKRRSSGNAAVGRDRMEGFQKK